MVAVAAVAGIVVGALVSFALGARRAAALRARADVAAAQLVDAREALERERVERSDAMRGLETAFKGLSQDVLDETVARFRAHQDDVSKERDARLDKSLEPLARSLEQYQRSLADYNKDHAGALTDVKHRAEQLLEAQTQVQETAARLAQILGRGDQRGRWGEVQLANVLEKSGLRPGIDYDLQRTETSDEGRRQRPDCVVKLPNGYEVAVDAKFPFDKFEEAVRTEDADERKRLFGEHAVALRKHMRSLREKGYWEKLDSPEFVVCFVPSDFAISAALDADPQLLAQSATDRVLLAGPTNLFALLWSVAMIVSQHRAMVNAQDILSHSQEIVKRIRNVFSPVDRMGKSLRDTVTRYNEMVASVESRLGVEARRIADLSGGSSGDELPALGTIDSVPAETRADRWGVGDALALDDTTDTIDVETDEP